jgi:two pore calcium channel protein
MITSLLIVMFFFTSLSVQLWGGLLYKNNAALKGTEYDEAHYYVLNYNDFLSAFGAWVLSLMCEYVPKLTDAVVATTSGTTLAYVVFLSFYFFTVSVMFELVKAFTIEVFIGLNMQEEQEQAAKKEKRADGRLSWLFGSKNVKDQDEKEEVQSDRTVPALTAALTRVSDMVENTGRRLHFRAISDEGGVDKLIKKFDKLVKEFQDEHEQNREHSHESNAHRT